MTTPSCFSLFSSLLFAAKLVVTVDGSKWDTEDLGGFWRSRDRVALQGVQTPGTASGVEEHAAEIAWIVAYW